MLYRDFAIATLLSAACVVDAALIAIEVGKTGPSFSPKNQTAHVGDSLQFKFEGNHTVTQASNGSTCVPMKGGIDSASKAKGEMFTVNVTKPGTMFFICTVGDHCPEDGMKFSVDVQAAAAGSLSPTTTKTSNTPVNSTLTGAPGGSSTGSSSAAASANSTDGSSSDNSTAPDPNGAAMHGVSSVVVTAMALFVGMAL